MALMSQEQRRLSEKEYHDRQARQRLLDRTGPAESLCFFDDAYLDHETWIRPAMDGLGEVGGLRVLDFGCGHGMAAVVLARRGARVTAFDLSAGYLDEARRRAAANGVHIDWLLADAERLPFADATFARIWGNAILHHVDIRRAGRELCRLLAPGGIAVFCEPWGENPLLRLARNYLPYPAKERTVDEQPLRWRHVRILREIFPRLEIQGFQLMSMARRVLGRNRLVAGLDWCDDLLLRRVPALRRYCRYVVLVLRR
jgi:2-polyprenyl-3-methyl-5-hydroxy-6-metoxy-1,4-benzoquinol methylase